ncbi:MAG TPA: hypothetical protein IAB27_03695 [Candidatus Coprosoma intestinipullorum]|uniref:Uncharacterized protein n=1 Tax=Candidatus Coprosoma intestinipullorum TaxID=2840752 RepID=A0A9D0ZQN1_9FIRM|nr:hypothetical protein [Candidatus Coprosoma intestinipullorum]
MIEEYIFKTIISFISLKSVLYLTKENWLKLNPKRNGFIKRNFNALVFCVVPVIRWIWVIFILVIGIALGNDEFADKVRKNEEK